MTRIQRSSKSPLSNGISAIRRRAWCGFIVIPFVVIAIVLYSLGLFMFTQDSNNNNHIILLLDSAIKNSSTATKELDLLVVQQQHNEQKEQEDGENNNNVAAMFTDHDNYQQALKEEKARIAKAKDTIAYAVSLTDCSKGDGSILFQIADGAAVLAHTIHENSIRNATSGSRYDYRLYVIYHPQAAACAPILKKFGFELIERAFPVPVHEIQGEVLRGRIEKNGCCGERELIKLEAFTLTQHELVVLLDLDVLILKPLDYLFDLMLDGTIPPPDHLLKPPPTLPQRIDMLYTLDYAMVTPERKVKPVQGGFVVIRSNKTVFDDYVDIVRRGDFREDGGWGGKTGKFWGAMTFQGLMPYYYHVLHPGRSVELNWCIYDNMCSPSKESPEAKCYTQQQTCEDCRDRPAKDIYAFHFTNCQKPWTCSRHNDGDRHSRLCREMHHAWFEARSAMERSWGRSGRGPSDVDVDLFNGFCHHAGHKGYLPIQLPTDFAAV